MNRLERILIDALIALFAFGSFLVAPAQAAVTSTKGSAVVKLPGDSEKYLPNLRKEIDDHWPTLSRREFPAGIIGQESLWKINATLKTSRELGCGLGQTTKAYNADGSVRFDALTETKNLDRSLSGWNWENCYQVDYQLRAVVIKTKMHNRNCEAFMADSDNALMCAAGQYNGGAGSTSKRIRSCRLDTHCNSKLWIGNLDQQCPQARTKVAGYGESFCDINSKYPSRVWQHMKIFQGLI